MKLVLTLALLVLVTFCNAQTDLVNDSTQSGGFTTDSILPERYAVNHVAYFPELTINVAALLGLDFLTLGNTYTLEFDFENLLDREVILAEVNTDCICEEATWSKSVIPSSLKRKITMKLFASVAGDYHSTVKLFAQDPTGSIPLAMQSVKLEYKVQ